MHNPESDYNMIFRSSSIRTKGTVNGLLLIHQLPAMSFSMIAVQIWDFQMSLFLSLWNVDTPFTLWISSCRLVWLQVCMKSIYHIYIISNNTISGVLLNNVHVVICQIHLFIFELQNRHKYKGFETYKMSFSVKFDMLRFQPTLNPISCFLQCCFSRYSFVHQRKRYLSVLWFFSLLSYICSILLKAYQRALPLCPF